MTPHPHDDPPPQRITSLDPVWGLMPPESDADLAERLAERIYRLLRHDFEKLMTLMYLVDVPERVFGDALAGRTERDAARELARIVIERESEKAHTRHRHGTGKDA